MFTGIVFTGIVVHRRLKVRFPTAEALVRARLFWRESRLMARWAGMGWLPPLLLALAGCTTTPQDPTAMIPQGVQASVMAEEHMRQARESANAGDPNAKATSVQDILARARTAETGPPGAASGSAAPAGASTGGAATSGPEAAALAASAATGSISPAAGAKPAPPAAPPRRAPSGRDFEVTFQGAEDTPAGAEAAAFAKAWKAGKVPAKAQVMITAGPGPGSSAFEQALLANKRLRAVRSLLPADLDAKQLYDPEMTPDTVRIVVGATD